MYRWFTCHFIQDFTIVSSAGTGRSRRGTGSRSVEKGHTAHQRASSTGGQAAPSQLRCKSPGRSRDLTRRKVILLISQSGHRVDLAQTVLFGDDTR